MRSKMFLAWWRDLNRTLASVELPEAKLGEALELYLAYGAGPYANQGRA